MGSECVTVLLHDGKELDHHLGGRAEEHLTLATAFGVGESHQRRVQHAHENHFEGSCEVYSHG